MAFTDSLFKSILQKAIEIEKWAILEKNTKPLRKELNFYDILDELRYDGQGHYAEGLEKTRDELLKEAEELPTFSSSQTAFGLFKKLRRIIEDRTDDSKKLLLYADSIDDLIKNDTILYPQIWSGEFEKLLDIVVSHLDGYDLWGELLGRIKEKDPTAAAQLKEKYDQLIILSNVENAREDKLKAVESAAFDLVSLMREIAETKPDVNFAVELVKILKQTDESLERWYGQQKNSDAFNYGWNSPDGKCCPKKSLEKAVRYLKRVGDDNDAKHIEAETETLSERAVEFNYNYDGEPSPQVKEEVFDPLRKYISALIQKFETSEPIYLGRSSDSSQSKGKTEEKKATKSNVSGMSWQEAQKKAEALVDEKGYLGFQKLAKAVGCSEGTLRKIIKEKSSKLRQAKKQYESTSKTLKAVGFTAKVVATYEDSSGLQLSDTETHGILAEMLDRIKQERPEMFEQTKKQLDKMNSDEKRKFAAIYQRDYQNKDKSFSKDGPKTQRQYKQV